MGRCIPCLPGGSLLGRQGDVRGERPWSRQVPGCIFIFMYESRDIYFVVTNSLVCFGCKRVTSRVTFYIELYVCNICTAAQEMHWCIWEHCESSSSSLRKLVACCKTCEFTNRLCYRSVVLDWFLAARTLLSCIFLLYWLLIYSEYIVVNVLVFISDYCCICTNSFPTRVLGLEVGSPNGQWQEI